MFEFIMKKRKLESFIINKNFQVTFVSYVFIAGALITGVFYGANLYIINTFTERAHAEGLPPDHIYFKFIEDQQVMMNNVAMFNVFLTLFVLCLGGLVLSHKVAGPLNRLKKHMDKLVGGRELEPFRFREKDFFPELGHSFNKLVKKYSGKHKKVG